MACSSSDSALTEIMTILHSYNLFDVFELFADKYGLIFDGHIVGKHGCRSARHIATAEFESGVLHQYKFALLVRRQSLAAVVRIDFRIVFRNAIEQFPYVFVKNSYH